MPTVRSFIARRQRYKAAPPMFGWVDAGKRKFFALLVVLIVVEVVVVVLVARAEHDRFPPVPSGNERIKKARQTAFVFAPRITDVT